MALIKMKVLIKTEIKTSDECLGYQNNGLFLIWELFTICENSSTKIMSPYKIYQKGDRTFTLLVSKEGCLCYIKAATKLLIYNFIINIGSSQIQLLRVKNNNQVYKLTKH